jgi:hypothetical protein
MADEQGTSSTGEQGQSPAKRRRRKGVMSPLVSWLRLHWPSALLTLLGLTMLGLGVFVERSDAAAAALVVLGPLVVVLGVLIELFAPRLLRLALSELSVELAPPPSAEELEQAGLPEPVAEALDDWFVSVTRLLPAAIERQVDEAIETRERRQRARHTALVEMIKRYRDEQGPLSYGSGEENT